MDKPRVVVSAILQDLKDGLTRDAIGEKYGLDKAGVKELFQNKHLKNKKTCKVKEPKFILIDDISLMEESNAMGVTLTDAAADTADEQEAVLAEQEAEQEIVQETTTEEAAAPAPEIRESVDPFDEN